MEQFVARCGFRCDSCRAFEGNNHSDDDRLRVSSAWSKYFGLKIPPEKLRCNGCCARESDGNALPDPGCQIRSCVVDRGMKTCADCFDYPCAKIEARMNEIEDVMLRFVNKIPHEEFAAYIAPYDARKTLSDLRDRRIDRID